uniref:DAGKc domain-containing protein n=1 Tax=Pinguiococcus pyrenoidosus TaxID=172671 RepID=A0A7R9UEW9_9STRA
MVDSADDGSTTKGSEDVVLEEAIGRFSWQRKRQRLRLSNSELHLDAVDGGRQHSLRISDIVGAEIVGEADAAAGAASNRRLMVYAYPRQSLCCRGLVRVAQHLELSVSSTDGELVDGRSLAEGWCNTINAVASGAGAAAIAAAADLQPAAVPRRRRFLVFVNPASGRRRALHLYRSVVEPLFREARIDALLVVTEGRDHAYTFVKDYAREDLVQFDAIVTIGGDGTLSEVVNGIGARSEASMIFESVPLGVIRGGSGNGVAVSLLKAAEESLDVLSSTFAVIKGRAHPFDLSQVEHPAAGRGDSSDGLLDQAPLDLEASVVEKKRKLGFLSLTWGLISDIDIESEVRAKSASDATPCSSPSNALDATTAMSLCGGGEVHFVSAVLRCKAATIRRKCLHLRQHECTSGSRVKRRHDFAKSGPLAVAGGANRLRCRRHSRVAASRFLGEWRGEWLHFRRDRSVRLDSHRRSDRSGRWVWPIRRFSCSSNPASGQPGAHPVDVPRHRESWPLERNVLGRH